MSLPSPRVRGAILSPRSSPLGDFAFLAFALTQAADGCLTYVGVSTLGLGIEANPLIVWYMAACGTGLALTAAKAFALLCGMALHITARHRTVGALALVYFVGAVCPWILVLWP